MNDVLPGHELDSLSTMLKSTFRTVESSGYARWKLTVSPEQPLGIMARMEEEWLLFEAPYWMSTTDESEVKVLNRLRQLLQWNAALQGGVKFGLRSWPSGLAISGVDTFPIQILAEVPLEQEHLPLKLSHQVNQVALGFAQAFEKLGNGMQGQERLVQKDSQPVLEPNNVLSLCQESGWPFVERERERFMVTLEVSHGFYQATVAATPAGLRISADLGEERFPYPPAQEAVARLLLGACGHLRLVRGILTENAGDLSTIGFEVVLDETPSIAELTHALSALSLACESCGKEATVLVENQEVAQLYLAHQGRYPTTPISPNPSSPDEGPTHKGDES